MRSGQRKPSLHRLVAALLTLLPNAAVTDATAQTLRTSRSIPPASISAQAASLTIVPSALTGRTLSPSALAFSASAPTVLAAAAASGSGAPILPNAAALSARIPVSAAAADAHVPTLLPMTDTTAGDFSEHVDGVEGNVKFDGTKRRDPVDLEAENAPPIQARTPIKSRLGGLTLKAATASRSAHAGRLKELRQVLGDGTMTPTGLIDPFLFQKASGEWSKARGAGLEGFLYSKLELERAGALTDAQQGDYFAYVDGLLSPVGWTAPLRESFISLSREALSAPQKNKRFNELLAASVKILQEQTLALDESRWGRQNSTYMIFARAYNKLRPGKNFFDSLDDQELARIKDETKAGEIWLMDIFQIGEVNRWGTGGGSVYSIKGYKIKPELGGEAGFDAFVARAKRAGLKVKTDFIPNHTSLDSDMLAQRPEGFLHFVPPQNLTDEQIMAGVPREEGPYFSPIYRLITTENYPENGKRIHKRILVHHPRTNYGDAMWVDLAQIDYSHPEARAWQSREMRRLLIDRGVDSVRRDMAYDIVNARFYHRWVQIIEQELQSTPEGWGRRGTVAMLEGFKARWAALRGAEFLEEATLAVKAAKPGAVMIDEAYSHATELSRAGSDGVYNKSDHDLSMGQVGLYDAMVSRDGARIRAALANAAFRRWQRGGAPMVNFIGTHDGGEGNPVDKFGRQFRAAAATAMLLRPILFYNGLEQGVGQKENLIADLSKSVDLEKAIPYDIPVLIDWSHGDPAVQGALRAIMAKGEEHRELLDRGVTDVLAPRQESPVVAYTVASEKSGVSLIVAANYSNDRAGALFAMDKPLLGAFGAFLPKADKRYMLRDALNQGADGQPLSFERSGKDLLDKGLYIELDGGAAHLFEVTELPAAPTTGPPQTAVSPANGAEGLRQGRLKKFFSASWDAWTQRLTDFAAIPFTLLQIPQIIQNVGNLRHGNSQALANLPWMGYSTGILGNMLLLSYFVSMKERSAARVQAIGVITSALVVGQIFWAGFMPAEAFFAIMPAIVGGLALNFLNMMGKLPAKVWSGWSKAGGLLGFVALPQVLWSSFAPAAAASFVPAAMAAFIPAAVVSFAPAIAAAAVGLAIIYLDSKDKLPAPVKKVWNSISGKTATALFMYGPIAQLLSNHANPAGMAGISVLTLLLAMAGNLVMLPRAMRVGMGGDWTWFTGSAWGVALGGWAVMLGMFSAGLVPAALFWPVTALIPASLLFAYLMNRSTLGLNP